jgi:hypothetical protein
MTCNNKRVTINVQTNLLTSSRIFIPIHNKKTNWLSICKFINRYRITRHLLHSGTLPLYFIAHSNLRNYSWMHSMILSIHMIYHKPKMTEGQFAAIFTAENITLFPQHFPVLAAFCLTNTTVQYALRRLRSGRRFYFL